MARMTLGSATGLTDGLASRMYLVSGTLIKAYFLMHQQRQQSSFYGHFDLNSVEETHFRSVRKGLLPQQL